LISMTSSIIVLETDLIIMDIEHKDIMTTEI